MSDKQLIESLVQDYSARASAGYIEATQKHLFEIDKNVKQFGDILTKIQIEQGKQSVTLNNTYEQAIKTNGRVNGHDKRLDDVDKKLSYATGAIAVSILIVMPLLVYIFNLYIGNNQIQRAVDYAIDNKLSEYNIEVK